MKPEITKKTQKIASAIYLVTGFFDEKEPLKWKLRTLASNLISCSVFIKDNTYSRADKFVVDLEQNLMEIEGLFTVAKHAGLVSPMNYDILASEFKKCLDTISAPVDILEDSQNLLLSKGFFGTDTKTLPQTTTNNLIKDKLEQVSIEAPSFEEKQKSSLLPEVETDHTNKGQNINEMVLAGMGQRKNKSSGEKTLKEFGAVAVKKNSRQSIIVNLLKRKKEIMIKDVSPLIDGCSEKTIQRELTAMVRTGVLHKEGEKRWSRYSLAHQ